MTVDQVWGRVADINERLNCQGRRIAGLEVALKEQCVTRDEEGEAEAAPVPGPEGDPAADLVGLLEDAKDRAYEMYRKDLEARGSECGRLEILATITRTALFQAREVAGREEAAPPAAEDDGTGDLLPPYCVAAAAHVARAERCLGDAWEALLEARVAAAGVPEEADRLTRLANRIDDVIADL